MAQRVAVVTGGMGGLGEAICMKLAKMGYRVVTFPLTATLAYAKALAEVYATIRGTGSAAELAGRRLDLHDAGADDRGR